MADELTANEIANALSGATGIPVMGMEKIGESQFGQMLAARDQPMGFITDDALTAWEAQAFGDTPFRPSHDDEIVRYGVPTHFDANRAARLFKQAFSVDTVRVLHGTATEYEIH